jgi:hypothetical protein
MTTTMNPRKAERLLSIGRLRAYFAAERLGHDIGLVHRDTDVSIVAACRSCGLLVGFDVEEFDEGAYGLASKTACKKAA